MPWPVWDELPAILPPHEALSWLWWLVPHREPRHANDKEVSPKFMSFYAVVLGVCPHAAMHLFSPLLFPLPSPKLLKPRGLR